MGQTRVAQSSFHYTWFPIT